MKPISGHELVRFIAVGILNTGFSYGVYAALLYAGLDYKVANLGAFLLGTLFSFRTQGLLVFRQTAGSRFLRYALAWLVIYGFNIGAIGLLMRAGLDAYWAGALALAPVVAFSYLVQKFWVFRH